MLRRQCDRCGKIIPLEQDKKEGMLSVWKEYDFCNECELLFTDWLKEGKTEVKENTNVVRSSDFREADKEVEG